MRKIEALGGIAYKFISPGRAGVPDRIIVTPDGRTYYAELKTDSGRVSALQEHEHRRLRGLGADVRVLWGVSGVDRFVAELRERLQADGASENPTEGKAPDWWEYM